MILCLTTTYAATPASQSRASRATAGHQGWSQAYEDDWSAFLDVVDAPSAQDVLNFGRMIGAKYGFDVNH